MTATTIKGRPVVLSTADTKRIYGYDPARRVSTWWWHDGRHHTYACLHLAPETVAKFLTTTTTATNI